MALDTYTQAQYISTPILFRVDLGKTTMTIRDSDNQADTALRASMPLFPEAPRTVAYVTHITTNRSTDLIALVKAVSDKTRKTKAGDDVTDVTLVDNTLTDSEKLATIDVSVFGASKLKQLRQAVGTPMAFFNLSIVCKRGDKPEICHYLKEKITVAPECAKTLELRQKGSDFQASTNIERLARVWQSNQARDMSGPQTFVLRGVLGLRRIDHKSVSARGESAHVGSR